jgi:hypothetical protein
MDNIKTSVKGAVSERVCIRLSHNRDHLMSFFLNTVINLDIAKSGGFLYCRAAVPITS